MTSSVDIYDVLATGLLLDWIPQIATSTIVNLIKSVMNDDLLSVAFGITNSFLSVYHHT